MSSEEVFIKVYMGENFFYISYILNLYSPILGQANVKYVNLNLVAGRSIERDQEEKFMARSRPKFGHWRR